MITSSPAGTSQLIQFAITTPGSWNSA